MTTFNGTSGSDNLIGGPDPDTLNGLDGNDALDGRGGVDQLLGGNGDDELRIADPVLAGEVFDGGVGNDSLYVSLAAQTRLASSLLGVSLTDVALLSLERLLCGETYGLLSTAEQLIQIDWDQIGTGLSSTAELVGHPGADALVIMASETPGSYAIPSFAKTSWNDNDTVSLVATGSGDYGLETSFGLAGLQTLTGGAGNDRLIGHGSTDRLDGGAGNDRITSGAGADILMGGPGSDLFDDDKAGHNGDTILDFGFGDTITFSDIVSTSGFSLAGGTLSFPGGSLALNSQAAGGDFTLGLVFNPGPPFGYLVAAVSFLPSPQVISDVHSDFNGDGRDDILWREANGAFSDWLGQTGGGFRNNDAAALQNVSASWKVAGNGDFNGDGRSDVLWRNGSTGQLSDWLGRADGGFVINDGNALSMAPSGWHVAATGDFNGDGRDDILWRSDTGALSNWLANPMGGFSVNDSAALRSVSPYWHVAGTGDINGDGRGDIVWRSDGRNSEVALSNWLGTADGGWLVNDAVAGTPLGDQWRIIGTGDFNGDSRSDLLWRGDRGQVSNWLGRADGGWTINDTDGLRDTPSDWQVVDIGDFNGDGRDDLLWRRLDGSLSDWLGEANGGYVVNDANAMATMATSWQIQAIAALI